MKARYWPCLSVNLAMRDRQDPSSLIDSPPETEVSMNVRYVVELEKRGLIQRQPGKARTIQVLVPTEEIPALQ